MAFLDDIAADVDPSTLNWGPLPTSDTELDPNALPLPARAEKVKAIDPQQFEAEESEDPTTWNWDTGGYQGPEDPLLKQIQTGFERAGSGFKAQAGGGMIKLGHEAMQASDDPNSFSSRFGKQMAERGIELADEATLERLSNPIRAKDGTFGYYTAHGVELLFGNILPMMGAAIVAGPGAGMALMTAQVYGDKYQQALREGRTPDEASMDATFYALSESLSEKIPLGQALKGGVKFWKAALKTGGAEGASEVLNSLAQQMYDAGMVDESTSIPDFLLKVGSEEAIREYRDALILGSAAGVGMRTAAHPFTGDGLVKGKGAPDEVPPVEAPIQETPPPEAPPELGPPTLEGVYLPKQPEFGPESQLPSVSPLLLPAPETVEETAPTAETIATEEGPLALPEPPPLSVAPEDVAPETEEDVREAFIQAQLDAIQARQETRAAAEPMLGAVKGKGVPVDVQKPTVVNRPEAHPFYGQAIPEEGTFAKEFEGMSKEEVASLLDNAIAEMLDKYQGGQVPYATQAVASQLTGLAEQIEDGLSLEEVGKRIRSMLRAKHPTFRAVARAAAEALQVTAYQKAKAAPKGSVLAVGFEGATSEGMSPGLSKFAIANLQHWLQKFAPEQKIVLIENSLWRQLNPASSASAFAAMNGESYIDGEGIAYFRYNPAAYAKDVKSAKHLKEQVFAGLAHEFGHLLELTYFDQASVEMKAALINDYQKWLRERLAKEGKETWLEYTEAKDVPSDLYGKTQAFKDSTSYKPKKAYSFSFSEYLAQQVSRYAHQDPTMLEKVKEFVRPLYEKLVAFFKANKQWMPQKSVIDWLDSLQAQVELNRIRKERIKNTDTANLMGRTEGDVVASAFQRIDKELGGDTGLYSESDGILDFNNDPALGPNGAVSPARATARYNKFIKYATTLTQIEDLNSHIPGVKRYTEAVRKWWADKSYFTQMADQRARELTSLTAEDLNALSRFVHERTIKSDELQRGLTPQENAQLAVDLGITLSAEAEAVLEGTTQDFRAILTKVYDVLEEDLARRYRHLEPIERQDVIEAKRAELRAERSKMLSMDYWPLSRFGRYWVQAAAVGPRSVQGRNFRSGEVFLFEVFETSKEAEARVEQLKEAYGDTANVGGSEFSDTVMSFQGMPPQLVRKLQKMMEEKLIQEGLSVDELAERRSLLNEELTGLDHILHTMAPGNSFRNRLQRRKRTPGYSMDAVRGYASYMQAAANHVSRIMNYGEMMDAIDEVKTERMRSTRVRFDKKIAQLEEHLRNHYEYAMNPGEEWAHLRAIGFLWYLGFNVKSAVVNLSQVPMFTFPFLSKRYGMTETSKELASAMGDIRKLFQNGAGLELDLAEMVREGQRAGFLDESLATELAALAEGSNLQRLMPGSFLKNETAARMVRTASHWGAFMFQKMEQVNRYQTFVAAYRLHKATLVPQGLRFESLPQLQKEQIQREAYLKGREAIEKTQFEYARWNRPKFMRGRASSFFLFKMYTQNALYFVITDPSKWRYLAVMAGLAGAMGLPGSDDLVEGMKLMAAAVRKTTGKEDFVLPDQAQVRQFLKDLNVNPDLFLNGVSHDLFGLWDLSGSIGQGSIVPGFGQATGLASGRKEGAEVWGRMFQEVVGPAWGIPIQLVNALTTSSPDKWREAEKALPKAIGNVSKAYRLGVRGHASNFAGHPIDVEFDPQDELHALELAGQALGFTPTRLARTREKDWARKETTEYWIGRRRLLMKQYSFDSTQGNRESRADLSRAIQKFNKAVPDYTLKITPKDRLRAVKDRRKAERKSIGGRPRGRQGRQLHREFDEAWEEESP